MGNRFEAFVAQRPRTVLLGLFGVFGLVTALLLISSAVVSLAAAVLAAVAWCWWLEKSSTSPSRDSGALSGARGGPRPEIVGTFR